MKTTDTIRKQVGEIGIDAGLCWVGDPCYVLHTDQPPKAIGKSWEEFCDILDEDGQFLPPANSSTTTSAMLVWGSSCPPATATGSIRSTPNSTTKAASQNSGSNSSAGTMNRMKRRRQP
jgi:hypothetical protein